MVADSDQFAIQRVLARYCHTCDDGEFAELAALFAPDGSFVYAGHETSGRDALVEYFTRIQPPSRRGKHLTTNAVATVDGERATVVSDWAFLVIADGVPTLRLAGRYVDDFVRIDGDWLIQRRDVRPMQAPPA